MGQRTDRHDEAASTNLTARRDCTTGALGFALECVVMNAPETSTPAVDGESYVQVDVTDWPIASREPLGTKPKRWLRDPEGDRWLMKYTTYNRRHDGTQHPKGDDWSERIANGVAQRLGVPAARTELAVESTARQFAERVLRQNCRRLLAALG